MHPGNTDGLRSFTSVLSGPVPLCVCVCVCMCVCVYVCRLVSVWCLARAPALARGAAVYAMLTFAFTMTTCVLKTGGGVDCASEHCKLALICNSTSPCKIPDDQCTSTGGPCIFVARQMNVFMANVVIGEVASC